MKRPPSNRNQLLTPTEDTAIELNKRFGRLVAELRVRAGWSQSEMARQCGLDRSYFSLLERGARGATLTTVVRGLRSIRHATFHPDAQDGTVNRLTGAQLWRTDRPDVRPGAPRPPLPATLSCVRL
jgi:DNA-binding XRE family transcriptional regulator